MISPDTSSVLTYGPIALSKNTGPGSLAGGRLVGLLAEGNWVAIRDGRVRAGRRRVHPPAPAREVICQAVFQGLRRWAAPESSKGGGERKE